MAQVKMTAPQGATSCTALGTVYIVSGGSVVVDADHVQCLYQYGYHSPVPVVAAPAATPKAKDREVEKD